MEAALGRGRLCAGSICDAAPACGRNGDAPPTHPLSDGTPEAPFWLIFEVTNRLFGHTFAAANLNRTNTRER